MAVTGHGMHHEVRGDGLRTIVLLPGFGSSIESWAGVVPLLDGYRTVVMDLPGHAGSTGARADGDLPRPAETVFDACAELDPTRFAVAGLSLGGAIAVRIARDHPGAVTAVVGVMPWNAGGTAPGDPVIGAVHDAYGDMDAIIAGVTGISRDPVPLMYVVGGQDTVVDVDKQIADVRRVPGGRLVLLADAGHLACYEMPGVLAAV